jgi:RNA polymerase sigma-70 factor (ECF subfamily)
MPDPHLELIQRALQGDLAAERELYDLLIPPIQASVANTLRRRVAEANRSRARHEVEDLVQDVLFALFRDGGKRLRAWDPERGLALPGYVKLMARHLVLSFLRKRERRVWEDASDEEAGALPEDPQAFPERLVARKELWEAVLAAVEVELTAQGRRMLQLLVKEGLPVAAVCEATGTTPTAVHIWRSRLLARVAKVSHLIRHGETADD